MDHLVPTFDARKPTNVLYGPLSLWLNGYNPAGPEEEYPDTYEALALALVAFDPEIFGPDAAHLANRLKQTRATRGFSKFHSSSNSRLAEVLSRRAEILEAAFAKAALGDIQAAGLYLRETAKVAQMATGVKSADTLSTEEAAQLSDEQLEALVNQTKKGA
jgi:hypothetical protein